MLAPAPLRRELGDRSYRATGLSRRVATGVYASNSVAQNQRVSRLFVEICRLDVARSSRSVWAKTSKEDRVFFVRMNNSSRPLPPEELHSYLADRWPDAGTPAAV